MCHPPFLLNGDTQGRPTPHFPAGRDAAVSKSKANIFTAQ